MTADMETLLGDMARRLAPSDKERARLHAAVEGILARAQATAQRFAAEGVTPFDPLLVGSAAKDTWIPGRVDLDLFLMFPPELARASLEELGLRAGKDILGTEWGLRYAEHPYVHGRFQGFDADVVPAYGVPDATRIQSAVDRTPFHNAWVRGALEQAPERKSDIRLAKAWLRGIGAYGAETALAGFSGYLTEVLVLDAGGFVPLVRILARLEPGARFEPGGPSQAAFPDAPLVLIDPVDPRRNAAAAVSTAQLERVRRAAQSFLAHPSSRFFEPVPLPPITAERAERVLGGGLALVAFRLPDMREDAIVPHVARAAESLGVLLGREGFHVLRSEGGLTHGGTRAYLLVRTQERELPAQREHVGPPERIGARAVEFRAKYEGHPDVVNGPYVVGSGGDARVAVTLRVHDRPLAARVQGILDRKVTLGKHVDAALARGPVAVLSLAEGLAAPDLRDLLSAHLSSRDPWERTGDPRLDYPDSTA